MQQANIQDKMPTDFTHESFVDLLAMPGVRIERIVSKGHASPSTGWYEQDENEWVMVLQGAGVLAFEDGTELSLHKGDYVNIPRKVKHKVTWTDPAEATVWLAVFYP